MICSCVQSGTYIHTELCEIHQDSPNIVCPHEWGGRPDCATCYYCRFAKDHEVHSLPRRVIPITPTVEKFSSFTFGKGAFGIAKSEDKMLLRCSTTVETKAANFEKFANLINNQFKHGGDKYKLPGFPDREATDVISSVFGGESEFDWILGTMMKYLFRFKNFEREKDLLKVATYCYILWLKQGNHLKETHDEDAKK